MLEKYSTDLFPKCQNPAEFLPALKQIFLQIPKGTDHPSSVDIDLQKTMFSELKEILVKEPWLVKKVDLEQIVYGSSEKFTDQQLVYALRRCIDDII